MKIVELTSNILLPITNEESDLMKRFVSEDKIAKSELDDREQVLANQLTVKDVLTRSLENGKIYYQKRIKQ